MSQTLDRQSANEKLHSACDECRTRKLKCSGELPQCARCRRETIQCVYSSQKPMGRPRKRRRDEPDARLDPPPTELLEIELNTRNIGDAGPYTLPGISNLHDISATSADGSAAGSSVLPSYLGSTASPMSTSMQMSQLDSALGTTLWDSNIMASTVPTPLEHEADQPQMPCTCLSAMYLALSDLQSMGSFAFPAAIRPQRDAMRTACTILYCSKCPNMTFSAMQNTNSLVALLMAIAERFHMVLKAVDAEADDLERRGEKKPFRVGDNSPLVQQLHTGTLDCPLGFDVLLDGKEWKALAKKAIRAEVIGGGTSPLTLSTLLDQFEQRQAHHHANHIQAEERARLFGEPRYCRAGDATCVRMINQVRAMVANMQWE